MTRERRSPLSVTMAVLAGAFVILTLVSSFWADFQWYSSVGHTGVYSKQMWLKVVLFVVVAGLSFAAVWGAATMAYRVRPRVTRDAPGPLDAMADALEQTRRLLFIVIPAIFALVMGLTAATQWRLYLMWRNAVTTTSTDPQFGRSTSFYMFDLPFYTWVVGTLLAIVVVAGLANGAVHYLFGGLRPAGLRASSPQARSHLMLFLAVFTLLKGASYWMDKYWLATKSDALMTGLKYTDVHALAPAKTMLTYIAVATGVLFLISVARPGWSLPFIAFGVMLASSLLLGGIYPALIQQLQVKPSELQRETPYIQRNIDATKKAYGLDKVQLSEYEAVESANDASTTKDAGTLANIRLIDPNVVSPTFRQTQQIRGFYAFQDSLDVDRYSIGGKAPRSAVLAVREVNLSGVADAQRNWFNDHMVFTHGYGVVAASGTVASPDGSPSYFESDIPPTGALDITQPRVYFGEMSPTYSIVGAPADAAPRELDYPDDKSANGQTNNTYDGAGGVHVGNLLQRLLFAVHYQEPNILLSNQMSATSRILYDREPALRVKKIAPWLTLDSDPYPVVADGRIVWVIDGYTTSNQYPYAARVSLGDVTADSVNTQDQLSHLATGEVNYIRNSVKTTVDAYDGTVHIYQWDSEDPVLQVWAKAFPGVVEPKSAIPASLLAHVRYPEDLFKVQRNVLARYHVSDAQAFYSGQDFWIVPDDPTKPKLKQDQPPYYLTVKMPDQAQPTFQLTTAFAPSKRQTLAAFMAVDSDPGEGYGTIRVLQLPRNTTIPGPTQVQNNFESDPDVSTKLSLLRSGGSDVELGNLLSLPVGGGLLYFEPVYVKASASDGYPLLRKVLVSFGSKVAFEDDLKTALAKVFGDQGSVTSTPTTTGTPLEQLAAALTDANKAYSDGQAALAKGDFTAYGAAQRRLQSALARATAAGARVK